MADMPSKPTRRESLVPGRRHLIEPALAGLAVVAYVVGVFRFLPRELPFWPKQLVGLGLAALASWFFLAVTRRPKPPEILVQRYRLAQHSDFGKQLYTLPEFRQRTVRLPGIGRVRLRTLGGLGIFFVVGIAWWLSRWPIRARTEVLEDMSVPLAEEVVAAVLVVPEPHMAVLQAPMVPRRARELAARIGDNAPLRQLALRELGQEHFEQARAVLDRARRAPGADPVDLGVLEAQLAMYDGRFGDAARSYERAVGQRPDDPLLWCQWTAALLQAGQFEPAERRSDYAARLCREGPPVAEGVAAACLHLQALVALNRGGDFDKAEDAARQSTMLWKRLGGPPPRGAAAMNNLGVLLLIRAGTGDNASAEELFDEARDQWTNVPGPPDPHLVAAWDNRAMLYCTLGQQDKAQQAVDQAMKIAQRTLPKDSPWLALHLATTSAVARAAGRWAASQADADKALVAAEKALGGEHPWVAAVLEDLMAIHTDQAHYAEAYSRGSRAGSLIKQLWGAEHPYLAMNRNGLANVEIAEGAAALARGKTATAEDHFARAQSLCQEAQRIVQQALGPKSTWLAEVEYTRGRLEVAREAPAAARRHFEAAKETWKNVLGLEAPCSISVLGDLASLDDDRDNPTLVATAVTSAKRAADQAQRVYGSGHPELARLLCILAVLRRQQAECAVAAQRPDDAKKDYDAALECLDTALKIRQGALPPFHPDLAATLEIYASVLRAMTPPETDRAAEMATRAEKIRASHAREDRLK
jgi:tetratricopeptide (TPR) repeat protein